MLWIFLIAIIIVFLIIVYVSVPWAENKVLFFPSHKTHWKPNIPHKNVYIDVPEQIADLVVNSQQQKENALNDPTRIDGNEKKENALL